jgi:hypothetical protein
MAFAMGRGKEKRVITVIYYGNYRNRMFFVLARGNSKKTAFHGCGFLEGHEV